MSHVELNRKFWAITDKDDVDPDSARYLHLWSRDTQPGWPELLQMHRVVVLAEAGTGKTQEFKETARRLHAEGKAAFFCAIEELVAEGIERAFDVGTFAEFNAWRGTDQPGWFFLDSVDEARLVDHDHFKRALKGLSQGLGPAVERAFICISGRGSDWNAISDLSLIEYWLPIPQKQCAQQDNEPGADSQPVPPENTEKTDNDLKIQVFRLAPLSSEQIQLFARHHNVAEPARFIEAIDHADARIFAERPRDLIDLIAYWQQNKKFASLEEMTEFNIAQKLTETNPKHGKYNPLTQDKARAGAEIVAATLTFSRCNFVALPDPQLPITPSAHALVAKEILPDWQPREIESLLRRALFDEATYGRARIHHRSVREYLTAQWLHKLLQQDKSRRNVEQWLFAERYGMKVVIPSMKPVAAWLALWDDRVCQRLCDIAPEILIGYGDPSRLSIPVRERLLRKFAEVCASNRYYDESLDISAVRRLADSRLATTINQLLEEYREYAEVRKLLLRTIWQGAIPECADTALSIALDPSMDGYTRLVGIRAIEVCGNTEQQQRIVATVLSDAETGDVNLTSAVIEQFFSQLITVDVLLETLEKIPKPKRFSVSSAAEALEEIAKNCPDILLPPLLAGLVRLIELGPYVDENYCRISKRYAWLLPHAGNVALRLLTNTPVNIDEAVLRSAELVAISRDYGDESYQGPKADIQSAIDSNPQLRRLFFWRAVERMRIARNKQGEPLDDWRQVRWEPAPWRVLPEDFPYFLAQSESHPDHDNQLVAYSVALALWNDAGRNDFQLNQLKTLADQHVTMAAKLHACLYPPPISPEVLEHQRKMAEQKASLDKEKHQKQIRRQEWINGLRADPSSLRVVTKDTIKEKFPNLYWLASNIRKKKDRDRSKWGVDQWESLIEEFGPEVAEASRDGLMAYWRLYSPVKRKDNRVPNGLIVGLVGLAIEARTKPEWAQKLTNQEALLAAQYALQEMNGFADWINDLLNFHPHAFDKILRKEFRWEFDLADREPSAPVHFMLAQLRYNGPDTLRARYVPYILQLLKNKEPWLDGTLESVLSILMQSEGLDVASLAKLARQRHVEADNENRALTWLVAWLCVDADNALAALQRWLTHPRKQAERQERMIRFCGAMGDHHFKRFGSRYRDFERLEILKKLVPLVYSLIRIEDDNVHDGVFTPDARDNAEGMRSYLLGKICDMPGPEAFEALLDFSKRLPHKRSRERMHVIALRRAAADAEFPPWQSADVIKFAQEGEKRPSNARELFELVCSRLDDIGYDLEDGDASIAATLQKEDEETNLRVFFTKELRSKAQDKYSVAPEEELADGKRPDIRVDVPGIDSPCVIELKISDNWSYNEHIERLQNQLVGQYLRDARSRYGVFLLVRRHKLHWRSNRTLTFEQLVACVQEEADRIVRERLDLEGIRVIGIDLVKRRGT